MLVSRRDRGYRNRAANNRRDGPQTERRQVPRRDTNRDGLGTQSRYAVLEGLEDADCPQRQEPVQTTALQQPEHPLPRIRTHDENTRKNPDQRNDGNFRGNVNLNAAPENQYSHLENRQIPNWGNQQSEHRGGYQNSSRGRYQNANMGGYQSTNRGGYLNPNRGGYQSNYGGSRGRGGRSGFPNQAAAESEHTVVRGSNRGQNITTSVVQHAYGQPDFSAMAESRSGSLQRRQLAMAIFFRFDWTMKVATFNRSDRPQRQSAIVDFVKFNWIRMTKATNLPSTNNGHLR
nr:uncharacterized protein LOC109175482 [Ipomoea trifida]